MNLQPHTRNSDPFTSYLAGEEITNSGKRATNISKVNVMVMLKPGLTSAELAAYFKSDQRLSLTRQEVARRLSDSALTQKGEPRKCSESGKCVHTRWAV